MIDKIKQIIGMIIIIPLCIIILDFITIKDVFDEVFNR
jgi:hypothetical protein